MVSDFLVDIREINCYLNGNQIIFLEVPIMNVWVVLAIICIIMAIKENKK